MTEVAGITASMQDYLETILELTDGQDGVRITDIAAKLNIAKASVNQAIAKLKEQGLVRQNSYGPVILTDIGREQAAKVRQRHHKLRKFLIEVLGVNPKVAEKDACLMEHVVSPETMARLTEYLIEHGKIESNGDVKCSQQEAGCGNANINYRKEGCALKSVQTKALNELQVGAKGIIIRVVAQGAVRRRMLEMGVTPGTEVTVKGVAPFGDPMEFVIKGYNLSLRKAEAADVFVEELL